jgi:hypothetical protein
VHGVDAARRAASARGAARYCLLPSTSAATTRARKALEEDLRSAKLDKEERVKARLYLAAALHASGSEEAARIQLEEVAQMAPSIQVDPILFPPEFVAMADRARKNVEARRQGLEDKRLAEERQRQEADRKRLEAERLARAQAEVHAQQPPFEPSPPTDVPVVTEGSGPLPYIATGGAVLALGAGAWSIRSSTHQRNQLDRSFDSSGRSTLTYPRAQELERGANRDMALFAASTATSAALTGVAIWLWTRSEE